MATDGQIAAAAPQAIDLSKPLYAQVNAVQWRAFWATFLGWVLDGFDFTILTFILIDIQGTFGLDRAQTVVQLPLAALT